MERHWGEQNAQPGIYLNLRHLSFTSLKDAGRLPGTEEDTYRRVPTLAVLAVGPIVAGLYVVCLPLIGFGMLAWVAGGKAVELTAHAGTALARVLKPAWDPASAFLSRGKPALDPHTGEDTRAEDVRSDDRPLDG
ncbi:MAG: hypothetical protein V3S01_12110 [Dehalococcoidia bacterium]